MPAEKGEFNTTYSSDAYTEKMKIWVPVREQPKVHVPGKAPSTKITGWMQGTVKKVLKKISADESLLLVTTEDGGEIEISSSECPLQNERDDTVDDLVRSDFLHEPGYVS